MFHKKRGKKCAILIEKGNISWGTNRQDDNIVFELR